MGPMGMRVRFAHSSNRDYRNGAEFMTEAQQSAEQPSEPNVVLATFLARFVADDEAGAVRPLGDYQAMFPGYEDVIAREYASLLESDDGDATPCSGRVGIEQVGPYRVLRELGRGGQSVVYLAEDPRLQRKVALKVLPATLLASDRARERFRREAELAAKLDHPGICVIFEHGEHEGLPYIAMRYVEGQSLAEHIATAQAQSSENEELTNLELPESPEAADEATTTPSGPTPDRREVTRIVGLLERVARALHSAHEEGLLHRDVKPGNIMVTPRGEPVILDFGLARDEFRDGKTITVSGDLMGTPAYMSPEQLLAQRIRLDRRSDVYSLGVTAYECLTLTRPFDAPTREGMYQRILTGEVPDPRKLNPAISRDLKVVLETALEKDRERRYPSALAFAEDLRRIRTFEPIAARPAGSWMKLRRWGRRHPALATAIVLVFVSLASGFLITWRFKEEAEGQAAELQVAVDRERATRAELEDALDARGRALRRSEALRLVERSRRERIVDPAGSVALALAAVERSREALTRGALAESLASLPHKAHVLGEGAAYAAFASDGARLVTMAGREFVSYGVPGGKRLAKAEVVGLNHRYIAVDRAGNRLAVLGEGRAEVFDAKTGKILAVVTSELNFNRAAFSLDGSKLALVGGLTTRERVSGRVWLVDLAAGTQKAIADTDRECWSVDFDRTGERIVVAARGGLVRVIEASANGSGKVLFERRAADGSLPWPAVVFSPDGARVFGTTRKGLWMWDLRADAVTDLRNPDPRQSSVNGWGLATSHDGARLLTWPEFKGGLGGRVSSPGPAVVWDLVEGRRIRALPGDATSAAISGDGRTVVTWDGERVGLFDLTVDGAAATEIGVFKDVDWLSLDVGGRRIAIVRSGLVSVVDRAEARAVPRLSAAKTRYALTDAGDELITFDNARGATVFDPEKLGVLRFVELPAARPNDYRTTSSREFDIDRSGRFAVVRRGDRGIAWVDVESGEIKSTYDVKDVKDCLLTGDGTTMLVSHRNLPKKVVDELVMDIVKAALLGDESLDGSVLQGLVDKSACVLMNLKTGKPLAAHSVSAFSGPVRSADGNRILIPTTVDKRPGALVIDGKTGTVLFEVNTATVSAEFSRDGSRLLVMSSRRGPNWFTSLGDAPLRVLDATTGEPLFELEGKGGGVSDAAWTRDGRLLVTAEKKGVLRIWSGTDGALIRAIEGHDDDVYGCAFSSDGKTLVSHSKDGTFRVWDVETGTETMRVHATSEPGERGAWADAVFAANDRVILVMDSSLSPFAYPHDPLGRAREHGIAPASAEDLDRLGL